MPVALSTVPDCAASSPADLFSGTAAALVRGGVSAVTAMQYEISDPAAVAFCRGFYSALAHGRAVDEAVTSGRVAIIGLSRRTLEWVTPVLYLRGRDSRLFTMPGHSSVSPAGPPNRSPRRTDTPPSSGRGDQGHTALPRRDPPDSFNAPATARPEIIYDGLPGSQTISSGDAKSRHQLEVGRIYTRAQLRDAFAIQDATLNNGVFPYKDRHEIWLFITEEKPTDRVQYEDRLIGDELKHRENGNKILVFYRRTKK